MPTGELGDEPAVEEGPGGNVKDTDMMSQNFFDNTSALRNGDDLKATYLSERLGVTQV